METQNTKHSPGPWIKRKGIEGDTERWIIVSGGEIPFHIATIENGQPGDFLDTEEATACLLESAPDLLGAALEMRLVFYALLQVLDIDLGDQLEIKNKETDKVMVDLTFEEVFAKMDAAIEKATPEKP